MHIAYLVGNGFDIKAGLNTAAPVILEEFAKMSSMVLTPSAVQYLVQDIRNKGFKVWSDFEKEIGVYSSSPFVQYDSDQYAEGKAYFDEALIALLQERCSEISGSWVQENAPQCIGSLRATLDLLDQGGPTGLPERLNEADDPVIVSHDFICFNYTSTLEKLYNKVSEGGDSIPMGLPVSNRYHHFLGDFCYAHGDLNDMPVCGVDSIEQITNELFHGDQAVRQTIVKSDIQRAFGQTNDTAAKELIDRANLICVYGMSFGSTDFRWWSTIAQKLASDPNAALLIFEHDYRGPYSVPYRRLRETQRARGIFLNAADLMSSPDKELVEEKLFVAPATQLFPIKRALEYPGIPSDRLRECAQQIFGSRL